MKILQKIRTSFTTQLMSWVAAFVLVISGVVLLLLVQFSQNVIHDETIDATMQALENTALRLDNTLKQTEMTARLEHQRLRMNRMRIETACRGEWGASYASAVAAQRTALCHSPRQ